MIVNFRVAAVAACLAFLFAASPAWADDCDNASGVTLKTKRGAYTLCGNVDDKNKLFVYFGIKYATAKRWNRATKIEPKPKKLVEAKFFGPMCPQDASGKFISREEQQRDEQHADLSTFQSEDCLSLNVYTQQPSANPSRKRPVMVFIHGGAFLSGSGAIYDGTALARKGAVVVTLNYRLGALGFLTAFPARPAPRLIRGNFGFADQQLAMTWAHDNAERFGGDPDNITLFGESAGAMSVGLHTFVASGSAGLFANAIMESNPLSIGYQSTLGAQLNGESYLLALCMRYRLRQPQSDCTGGWIEEVTLQEITDVQGHYLPNLLTVALSSVPQPTAPSSAQPPPRFAAIAPSPPVSDERSERALGEVLSGALSNKAHFITLPWAPHVDGSLIKGQPLDGYALKSLKRKPIVFGVNSDEGMPFAAMIDQMLRANGANIGPKTYAAILDSSAYRSVRDDILNDDRYNPDRVMPAGDLGKPGTALGNLMTDHDFICGNIALADRLLEKDQQGSTPIYTYDFAQRPFFNIFLGSAGGDPTKAIDEKTCDPDQGKVCHSNEIPYVFDLIEAPLMVQLGYKAQDEDRTLRDRMVAAWFNFAASAKSPSGDGWVKYTDKNKSSAFWQQLPDGKASPATIDLDAKAKCSDIWFKTPPLKKG